MIGSGQRIAGQVALVTGGASGIGRACAARLAREGALTIVSDVDEAGGERVVDEIRAAGGEAEFHRHEVASEEDWRTVIAKTGERHGRLDILVNNAGIALGGPITDMSLEAWRRLMSVNLDGVFLGVKHALPLIRAGGRGGSIVNMSSIAGLKGVPGQAAYSASKAAVRMLTKAVALECAAAKDRVRVNSVHPGLIDTPIYGARREQLDEMAARLVPLGCKGSPEDIADAVLWLASSEARYVTGAEIVVDGGFTIR